MKRFSDSREVYVTQVLLADDHPVTRAGLRHCLSRKPTVEIVGEAADGAEAVSKTIELGPDLVLMDSCMPVMDGLAATELLRHKAPDTKVLIMSGYTGRDRVFRAMDAGAHGFISKNASLDEVYEAIQTVHRGEYFFESKTAAAALDQFLHGLDAEPSSDQLSERERKVLTLVAEGVPEKRIAVRLGVEVRSIRAHRERIMRRLDIRTLAGLTKYAVVCGLIPISYPSRQPELPPPARAV